MAQTAGADSKPPAAQDSPFPLTDLDRFILSQTDEEYVPHDFADMKRLIGENKLELFKRRPSDLRAYMAWSAETKAAYGSMTEFLATHRLPPAWGPLPYTDAAAPGRPFADPADYRVLVNDWPYGMTPDLKHLVVWSRVPIASDPSRDGDMTPESRDTVGRFVQRFFADRLGPGGEDHVLWFKNWVALQSVRSVDHVHVIVKDVGQDIIDEWTKELDCHRLQN